ncbi:bifunctional nicotinamide-nucleotide adenylyltransferase/Nudix hydroxylase [Cysteiniphilum halobium]|uniref:bifunctional nicotinamide-nucleotide adenylyltransferase/Nudix hydroxylase n=1 Tax=Cysteiniphilum halobium TaxID=2219059 RepID=UPI001F482138|nr:bifunctional nicotinamide-nucleotide adenylyltransferase/Nudix hydroxylase [Cysteiniphilum halobium]
MSHSMQGQDEIKRKERKEKSEVQYDYGVFIGRFQPFHVGHLYNIRYGLLYAKKIIILIGSAFRAPSIKNPFSYEQRRTMILSDLKASGIDLERIIIEPVSDWFYNEAGWRNEVQERVEQHANKGSKVAIVGHQKDASSYYLKCFPLWQHIDVTNFDNFNATDFRVKLFKDHVLDLNYLIDNEDSKGSLRVLQDYMQTPSYKVLCDEFNYIANYKASWQDAPFKPVFVTTDAMVLCNKHLLLIQRKQAPGKNLWALPGGFLDQDERIIDGILRELEEETTLSISLETINQTLLAQEVFDHPDRSLRGRVITHLGLIILSEKHLPNVIAQDDAKAAKWIELSEVLEKMSDCLMDDHYQIIKFMASKYELII